MKRTVIWAIVLLVVLLALGGGLAAVWLGKPARHRAARTNPPIEPTEPVEPSTATAHPPVHPPDKMEILLPGHRPLPEVDPDAMAPYVAKYCGACHKTPPAEILPKPVWVFVVSEMTSTWLPTLGIHLTRGQMEQLASYYVKLAPIALPILPENYPPSPIAFEAREIGNRGFLTPLAANVNVVDLDQDGHLDIVVCDAELHTVSVIRRQGAQWTERKLADIKAPVHTEVFDADGDGDLDILVAALGQLMPTDKLTGRVVLLRQVEAGRFEPQTIVENIARVTDARPADVDGDGDLDYIVGMFGWRKSGGILWMRQLEDGSFEKNLISEKHGPIRLRPTDLNGDGLMDFVIMIAQEFEQIVAFINTGDDGYGEDFTRFEPHILYEAPYPMYGSSGMSMVDLDRDGDLDVLFTNGDAFDLDKNPKPYHGVQWLENRGGMKFRFHDIGRFYGAMASAAGDLDGDGDLDVVAASQYNDWRRAHANCLVWYENDGRQHFTRHNLGRATTHLATVAVGDLDGDGRLDIVGGSVYTGATEIDDDSPFQFPPPGKRKRVMLWRNLGPTTKRVSK